MGARDGRRGGRADPGDRRDDHRFLSFDGVQRRAGISVAAARSDLQARRPVRQDRDQEGVSDETLAPIAIRRGRGLPGRRAAGRDQHVLPAPDRNDHDLFDPAVRARYRGGLHRPGVARPCRAVRHRLVCRGRAVLPSADAHLGDTARRAPDRGGVWRGAGAAGVAGHGALPGHGDAGAPWASRFPSRPSAAPS
ncbi:hypothetical protein G6F22_017546 [Rhizopus arrhizus]|nr:hypothetical protein G6F22_017546 [Rhizopus arrhizus]